MIYKMSISVPTSALASAVPYTSGLNRTTPVLCVQLGRSFVAMLLYELTPSKVYVEPIIRISNHSAALVAVKLWRTVPHGNYQIILSPYRRHWDHSNNHRPDTSDTVAAYKALSAGNQAQHPFPSAVFLLRDGWEILAPCREHWHHQGNHGSYTIVAVATCPVVSGGTLA